jgi:uncharacterized protein (TIGR03067 family)
MLLVADRERVREERTRIDRERLQGRWIALSGRRAAQMHIEDDQFVLSFRNGDVYSGTLILDPTQHPRAVDLLIDEGPTHHQNKLSLAIYEFDGEHLILSPATPGTDSRPRAFPPEGDETRLCLVFRRC